MRSFQPPYYTTAERDTAVANGALQAKDVIYNESKNQLERFDGTDWRPLVVGSRFAYQHLGLSGAYALAFNDGLLGHEDEVLLSEDADGEFSGTLDPPHPPVKQQGHYAVADTGGSIWTVYIAVDTDGSVTVETSRNGAKETPNTNILHYGIL